MNITARFVDQAPPERAQANREDRAAPSAAAKNLAMAHHLARLIDRGLVADYTAAARLLGVSQPRLTHLMGLLLLAPEIQESIVFGELVFGDKELRVLARIPDWSEQKAWVARRGAAPKARRPRAASHG